MSDFKTLVESFTKRNYKKVQRNDQSYRLTLEITISELTRLIEMYSTCVEEDQTARLIRDSIDHWIRRYHDYAIRGNIGSHYRQTGTVKGETVFEHVVPANEIRDMLLEGKLTVRQALNAPTCLISKVDDVILRQKGLSSSSPSRWFFFQRYSVLQPTITTFNGKPININDWTLEDHYKLFGDSNE